MATVFPKYECTLCGAKTVVMDGQTIPMTREFLTVKKISFMGMGPGAKTLRSRVVDWLCPPCVKNDTDYNRLPFVAPGNTRVPPLETVSG